MGGLRRLRFSHRPDWPFNYASTALPIFDRNLKQLAEKVRAASKDNGLLVTGRSGDKRDLLAAWAADETSRFLVRQRDSSILMHNKSLHSVTELVESDRYVFYRSLPTDENPTGYRGRTSILELLTMTDPVRRLVMQHATSGDIQDEAVAEGMRTMYQDGLNKCLLGVTTLDEVLRVTQEA